MQRLAAPMVGGMITAPLLSLFVIPAIYALIGMGEALITVAALSFILRTRPDVLGEDSPSARGGRGWAVAGTLIALAVAMLSPWASTNPDGLIRAAACIGLLAARLSHLPIRAPGRPRA